MTQQVQQLLANVNGTTFISLDTTTQVKLAGGKKNPMQGRVTKVVKGSVVMVFQNKHTSGYENMVQRRLAQEGKDPASFSVGPRAWGHRIPNTPFVEHNGAHYLEVIFLKCGDVTYRLDNKQVARESIEGLEEDKQEGQQGGLENKVIIRTYKVDSIDAITVDKQRHELH